MSTLDDTRHPRRIDHRGNDRGDAVRPGPHLGGVEVTSPALTRPGPWAWRKTRETPPNAPGRDKRSARCGQKSALARKGRRKNRQRRPRCDRGRVGQAGPGGDARLRGLHREASISSAGAQSEERRGRQCSGEILSLLSAIKSHAQSAQSRDGIMKAVNREAEIASLLISGFGVAFFGWALVHLASSPSHPNKDDRRATESRFRRWLDATRHPLLKAENDSAVAAGERCQCPAS